VDIAYGDLSGRTFLLVFGEVGAQVVARYLGVGLCEGLRHVRECGAVVGDCPGRAALDLLCGKEEL